LAIAAAESVDCPIGAGGVHLLYPETFQAYRRYQEAYRCRLADCCEMVNVPVGALRLSRTGIDVSTQSSL
jgi:hypothetical protein